MGLAGPEEWQRCHVALHKLLYSILPHLTCGLLLTQDDYRFAGSIRN